MRKKLVAFACLTLPLSANAAMVTYSFSGTFDRATPFLVPTLTGTTITGTVQWDTSVAAYFTYPTGDRRNYSDNGIFQFSIDTPITTQGTLLYTEHQVDNNNAFNGDIFQIADLLSSGTVKTGDLAGQGSFRAFALTLKDSSAGVFNDSSTPTSITLTDFDSAEVKVTWTNLPGATFTNNDGYYTITEFVEVQAVPIPAAAWLFGSALLGLGVVKRKKA